MPTALQAAAAAAAGGLGWHVGQQGTAGVEQGRQVWGY